MRLLKDIKNDETQLLTNIKKWGTEVYSDYVEGIKKELQGSKLSQKSLNIVTNIVII